MVTEAQNLTGADYLDPAQEQIEAHYSGDQLTAFYVYLSNDHVPLAEWQDYTDKFEDAYAGFFNSRTEFTHDYLDSTGLLNPEQYEGVSGADLLIRYFDADSFGRDLMHDYWETDGYYFRSY
jgi:antirestriction protein